MTDERAERDGAGRPVSWRTCGRPGRRPYVIGVGGSGADRRDRPGPRRARGRRPGARRSAFVADDLVVPSATGGTQAGLARRAADGRRRDRRPRHRGHAAGRAAAERSAAGRGARGGRRPGHGPRDEILLDGASSAPATAGRPRRPTTRRGSSPGPRASWSTRSTPPRLWPGSSTASAPGGSTATASSSGTPAARPACSNRSTPELPSGKRDSSAARQDVRMARARRQLPPASRRRWRCAGPGAGSARIHRVRCSRLSGNGCRAQAPARPARSRGLRLEAAHCYRPARDRLVRDATRHVSPQP